MHVTKRILGEGYIVGTSTALASVLFGVLVIEGFRAGFWVLIGLVPVAGLAGLVYWVRWLDLDGNEVWNVAKFAALGAGMGTLVVVSMHLSLSVLTVSAELAIALATTVGALMIAGGIVGVAYQLRRSQQRLTLRNAVLYRVLRHNLRNDMTVVLSHLDDVKTDADEQNRRKIEAAEHKIDALMELTDKVRQINITMDDDRQHGAVDLASLVDGRVDRLRKTHPGVQISTDLPETAPVYADEQFGIVLDNVVESAVTYGDDVPELAVDVSVDRDEVVLGMEDRSRSIPRSDLSAVAAGAESDLRHGCGMELWLVYWLTDRNDGDLAIETSSGTSRIEITLQRALDGRSMLTL